MHNIVDNDTRDSNRISISLTSGRQLYNAIPTPIPMMAIPIPLGLGYANSITIPIP